MNKIEQQYKSIGLKFDVAQDASLYTIDAANAVKQDLLTAFVLVAFVMLMFLHSMRNSVIVLISIPTSLITTFGAIYAFGFTLNLMTLLGLSLVVGILVDDSIVVLENIYHHLERGEEKRTAALKGRNEIGFAALAITFVDVAVFLPLALIGGIIGNILREFSLVIVISTLTSLLVSFTLTPFLASRFCKLERFTNKTLLGRFALWFEKQFNAFREGYINLLKWSFNHKVRVAAIAIILFFASFSLIIFRFIGFEFMTQADQGQFAVQIDLEPGTPIEKTNLVSRQVEQAISKYPEVEKIFTNAGSSSEGLLGFSTPNSTEIDVILTPKSQRSRSTDEIGNLIKEDIKKIPGARVRVNPIGLFGVANQTPIQLLISGPSYADVLKVAKQLQDTVKTIPGTADVRLSSQDGNPETHIELDRRKLVSYGLTLADVGTALQVAFTGNNDSKLREEETDYDIRVILDKSYRTNTDELNNISFVNGKGEQIYLKQFANIYQATGPTKLTRYARSADVIIYSQVVNRPSGSIAQDIIKKLDKYKFPAGMTYTFMGDVKSQNDSFGDMGLAFLAGILFTYMIMVALYDSFLHPFVVLFSIPLAMIGALLALALTMKALNIFTFLGIIMLTGLVAKNAILLVDRTNNMRLQGESVKDALIDAGRMRIRPIFMTTLTMIFAMMPVALSTKAGAEWKSGLAWALIGGLTSSLFLTLIVVPVVYLTLDNVKVWLTVKVFHKEKVPKAVTETNLPLATGEED
jgi:HAE1 family hydrophobic/amphiphilic exporter-1